MINMENIAEKYENLPQSLKQLVESAIVLDSHKKVQNAEKICEHPEGEIHDVQQQLIPTLPHELFTSLEPLICDYKKQINDSRRLYEMHAQKINLLISQTKSKIKNFYIPLQEFKKEIEKQNQNLNETIINLLGPLKNKVTGVENIDLDSIPNEKRNQFLNDKKEIDNAFTKFSATSEEYSSEYSKLTINKMKEINKFVDAFLDLAGPAQILSGIIEGCFKYFEEQCEELDEGDLHNPEKMKQLLENIRDKINSEFSNDINETSEMKQVSKRLQDLEELDNTNNNSYTETIEKMKTGCAELNKQSEEINNKINDLREKYNQEKIELGSKIIIELPDRMNDESRKTIKQLIKTISEVKQKQVEIVIKINKENKIAESLLKLDILLIMDITNSMSDYLNQIKEQVISIKNLVEKKCPNITLRIGFVGYKDYLDYQFDNSSYVNLGLTKDFDDIRKGIENIVAGGGSDVPEDLAWAMEKAMNQKWEAQSKFALLVTDAPCHGKKYHDLGKYDKSSNVMGDADYDLKNTKVDIDKCVEFFAKNEINFYCLKISELTNKMFGIFQSIYNKNKPTGSKSIFKIENDSNPQNLPQLIVDAVINIFRDRKELTSVQSSSS